MTIYDESNPAPKRVESIDPVRPGPAPIKLPMPGPGSAVVDALPDGRARLEQYAARMRARAKAVEEIFEGDEHSPSSNKEYKKFLRDQAATSAMRYVMTGQADPLDEVLQEAVAAIKHPDVKADALRKQGFAVSGDPAAIKTLTEEEAVAEEKAGKEAVQAEEQAAQDASNAAFFDTPAARLAVSLGFDPNASDDE